MAEEAEETTYWLQLCTRAPAYPASLTALNDTLLSAHRRQLCIIISSKATAR